MVDYPEHELRLPAVAFREVADLLVQQFGIRDHQLLPFERAKPRGLQADSFDRADALAVADRVSAPERLVEQDRKRCEQVGKDALGREPDGNAADTESGDQRGDVDAEIVENDDDGDREQGDADQYPDKRHRIGDSALGRIFRRAPADQPENELPGPDCALEGESDDEEDIGYALDPARNLGVRHDDVERGGHHEEDARFLKYAANYSAPARALRIARHQPGAKRPESQHHKDN